MAHVRGGAPTNPMTPGKIERLASDSKNRISVENYYLPGDRKPQIEGLCGRYNHSPLHESVG